MNVGSTIIAITTIAHIDGYPPELAKELHVGRSLKAAAAVQAMMTTATQTVANLTYPGPGRGHITHSL